MIRTIKVDINAAFPNMPLLPFQVFHDSSAALTILNVPRRIVSLSVKVKNVNAVERIFPAQRSGSAWVAVIPGEFFSQSGTSTRGVKIEGADEAGNIYTLGAADLVVMLDNGSVTPVSPSGDGDMKHSEFADLEVHDNMTQKESNALIKIIVGKLKGGVALLLMSACCLPAFAEYVPLSPDMEFGDINPTQKLADVIHAVVNGAARPLPKYLHALDFCDTYPDEAEWYYNQPQDYGFCSAVRDGGFLYRNYDWKFDAAAEFVVRMAAGNGRFASIGVANVGTNLTEEIVTSGKPSRYYRCLPGRVVDGINENGVVCEVNVVDGTPPASTGGDIHPCVAVRWSLDHGTSAGMVASNLAARIAFPAGWTQNFHWMVADAAQTWIVENGTASNVTGRAVMTNFPIIDRVDGMGFERWNLLNGGANITNAWFTRAYLRTTNWESDFEDADEMEAAKVAWETHGREQLRGKGLWQTVHTSIYDITNRMLRVAVQEVDDWYMFAVPSAGGVKPEAVREIVEPMIGAATNGLRRVEDMKVYDRERLETWKLVSQDMSQTNTAVGVFEHGVWDWYIDGTNVAGSSEHDESAIEAEWVGSQEIGYSGFAYRDLGDYKETYDRLATTNGVAQAIEANEKVGTSQQIVRGTLEEVRIGVPCLTDVDVSYSFESEHAQNAERVRTVYWEDIIETSRPTTLSGYGITDGATKEELAGKRDLTNNVCAVDAFGEWSYDPQLPARFRLVWLDESVYGVSGWYVVADGLVCGRHDGGNAYSTELIVDASEWSGAYTFTATRSSVCTSNELFVTQSFVTNSIKTLAPAPGNYAAVSNAAMSAISTVTNADANLIYTITSDGAEPRFYFTPVGAINAED